MTSYATKIGEKHFTLVIVARYANFDINVKEGFLGIINEIFNNIICTQGQGVLIGPCLWLLVALLWDVLRLNKHSNVSCIP